MKTALVSILVALLAPVTHAIVIDNFSAGLSGWNTYGAVSVQNGSLVVSAGDGAIAPGGWPIISAPISQLFDDIVDGSVATKMVSIGNGEALLADITFSASGGGYAEIALWNEALDLTVSMGYHFAGSFPFKTVDIPAGEYLIIITALDTADSNTSISVDNIRVVPDAGSTALLLGLSVVGLIAQSHLRLRRVRHLSSI